MFGMGMPEILLIMAIALIVIGPKKLPDLAKSMGKAFGEFKRATQDFKQALDVDNDLRTVKRTFDDIDLGKIADAAPPRPSGDAEAGADADSSAASSAGDAAASKTESSQKTPENADPAAEKASGADPNA
ncbi:MAG: twin-arginine translocase TatA/TatE family subunit [Pseudomonadota bacterium]